MGGQVPASRVGVWLVVGLGYVSWSACSDVTRLGCNRFATSGQESERCACRAELCQLVSSVELSLQLYTGSN